LMHNLEFFNSVLCIVLSADSSGANNIYEKYAVRYWLENNIGTLLVSQGAVFSMLITDNVYTLTSQESPKWHLYFSIGSAALSVIISEVAVIVSMALSQFWPQGIFLLGNGPIILVMLFAWDYYAHQLRKMVDEFAGLKRDADSQSKIRDTLYKLFVAQILANITVIVTGVACITLGYYRIISTQSLSDAITPTDTYQFDPFLWLQLVIQSFYVWYCWTPLACILQLDSSRRSTNEEPEEPPKRPPTYVKAQDIEPGRRNGVIKDEGGDRIDGDRDKDIVSVSPQPDVESVMSSSAI